MSERIDQVSFDQFSVSAHKNQNDNDFVEDNVF